MANSKNLEPRKNQIQNTIGRRQLLAQTARGAVAAAIASAGAGCNDIAKRTRQIAGPAPLPFEPLPLGDILGSPAIHAINRISFGPCPGDIARVFRMGPTAWVEQQLADDENQIHEDPAATWRVNALDTQQTTNDAPDAMYSMEYEQLLRETQQAALLRATYSRHQLREVMADFWTNHFNIYALKSDGQVLVPVDTETVIRKNIWSFPDMLLASAHSPAMLNYLDNKLNRKGVPNENYARELLELHTLGVNSGYTLTDIKEVARCFTGWTIKTGWQRGQFEFTEPLHDTGRKVIPFLNLTIQPGGGVRDAENVIHALATHPVTGRFLARKLCMKFLGCAPDEVVQKSADRFVQSHGDVRRMLRPILLDALFTQSDNRPILKRPLDILVSSLRVLAADTQCNEALQNHLAAMGQPLYQWPMPDGFPEKATAWTGSVLPRWNFAMAIAANAIPGTTVDLSALLAAGSSNGARVNVNAVVEAVICAHSSEERVQELKSALEHHTSTARSAKISEKQIMAECFGLALASPGFQWK